MWKSFSKVFTMLKYVRQLNLEVKLWKFFDPIPAEMVLTPFILHLTQMSPHLLWCLQGTVHGLFLRSTGLFVRCYCLEYVTEVQLKSYKRPEKMKNSSAVCYLAMDGHVISYPFLDTLFWRKRSMILSFEVVWEKKKTFLKIMGSSVCRQCSRQCFS